MAPPEGSAGTAVVPAAYFLRRDMMRQSNRARSLCVGIPASLLWWGVAFPLPSAEAGEDALNVSSSPAGVTVEAHDVGVEEVLREMGEKIGFTVVAKEATHPAVNVSIKDATPEEALQQVLRGENYAIVYHRPEGEQPQAGKIDKILLLSPPNGGSPDVNSQPAKRGRPAPGEQGAPGAASLPEQATAAVFGKDGWKVIQPGAEASESATPVANPQGQEDEGSPAAISKMLKAQALQALAEQNQAEAEGDQ
ncbi:MAG TPA: hypothetical protein VKJ47_00305 [Candidatus Binatia bacterium]|nr:hypothetical protein [Candidatus Binatia bacterium]